MTYYYYIAANIPLDAHTYNEHIFSLMPCEEHIKGFTLPIQLEINNGLSKKRQAQSLLNFLYAQTASYESCTIEIAHLLNSNHEPYRITQNTTVDLHTLQSADALLLQVGQLLTIRKVPVVS